MNCARCRHGLAVYGSHCAPCREELVRAVVPPPEDIHGMDARDRGLVEVKTPPNRILTPTQWKARRKRK